MRGKKGLKGEQFIESPSGEEFWIGIAFVKEGVA